jgi:hypothetical protein
VKSTSGLIRLALGATSYGDIGFIDGTGVTIVANTRYYVEACYNELDSTYRLYINGVTKGTPITSSTRVCTGLTTPGMTVGGYPAGGSEVNIIGYMDKFEFLPYCDHPAGTTYTPPSAAPNIAAAGYAQDWYDWNAGLIRTPTAASTVAGTNPSFGTAARLYLGKQGTNGTGVTSTETYAYNGHYDQTFATTAISTVKNHNLGVIPGRSQLLENGVTVYKSGGIALTADTATWTAAAATTRLVLDRNFPGD